MLTKISNYRLSFSMVTFNRSATTNSVFSLGNQMKLLNDNKQFSKTLQLFEKYRKDNSENLSSLTITQVLKACAHLKDIQCGKIIHDRVSSRIKDDPYILTALIQMYSKLSDEVFCHNFSFYSVLW